MIRISLFIRNSVWVNSSSTLILISSSIISWSTWLIFMSGISSLRLLPNFLRFTQSSWTILSTLILGPWIVLWNIFFLDDYSTTWLISVRNIIWSFWRIFLWISSWFLSLLFLFFRFSLFFLFLSLFFLKLFLCLLFSFHESNMFREFAYFQLQIFITSTG